MSAANANTFVSNSGQLMFTDMELSYLKSYLDRHDRGGYYMALYNMTGLTQALEQAQIATFSEGLGGTAYFEPRRGRTAARGGQGSE